MHKGHGLRQMIISEPILVDMRYVALILGAAVTLGVAVVLGEGEAVEPWWNNAVYYRMLVDSFKDGDGDGLGDLMGATKQISYARAVGVDGVIVSPLAARSKDCAAPGVVDFSQIDSRYGDAEMFTKFLSKANKLELKVVITLQFEAISIASEWFKLSTERKVGYEDRLLWRDGVPDEAPTAGTGFVDWTWSETRKAYYALSNNEAVLNLCSDSTATALSTVQCAWLKSGVDGVLLKTGYTLDFNCSARLVALLAVDARSCARSANLKTPVVIVESAQSPAEQGAYYGEEGDGANSVVSEALTAAAPAAPHLVATVHAAMAYCPHDIVPTWQTSTPTGSRIMSRYGSNMVDAINLLTLILPGAAIIQQGDELGAADTILEWATSSDCWPIAGSSSSAPLPWDDTPSAGFTTGQPWLPIAPNYRYANAKSEFANDLSHLGVVRTAAAMRKSPANGAHTEIKRLGSAIAVLRWGGSGSLLVVANLGRRQTDVQLTKIPGLPPTMTVAAASSSTSVTSGSHIAVEKGMKLGPGEAVLLAGPPRHCGGPGPVDKIANKLNEGWQKINKYFSNI